MSEKDERIIRNAGDVSLREATDEDLQRELRRRRQRAGVHPLEPVANWLEGYRLDPSNEYEDCPYAKRFAEVVRAQISKDKNANILVTRDELPTSTQETPIEELSIMGMGREGDVLYKANAVVFLDRDGRTKVMKHRHGLPTNRMTFPLREICSAIILNAPDEPHLEVEPWTPNAHGDRIGFNPDQDVEIVVKAEGYRGPTITDMERADEFTEDGGT